MHRQDKHIFVKFMQLYLLMFYWYVVGGLLFQVINFVSYGEELWKKRKKENKLIIINK